MSFIITATTQEGIVLASDSRLTINNVQEIGGKVQVDNSVSHSDNSYKTFLASDSIGISTFGAATIKGIPLSGYIDAFIRERVDATTEIHKVPQMLIDYSKTFPEIPDAGFHIAGYAQDTNGQKKPYVSRMYLANGKIDNVVPSVQMLGVIWDGESDVMIRILNQQIGIKNSFGTYDPLPNYNIPFDMFTLQDAIDFAVYAVRATKDTMRFQMRCKTVGGPVDVLIIRPGTAQWLSHKTLHKDND